MASAPLTVLIGKIFGIRTVQTVTDINAVTGFLRPVLLSSLKLIDHVIATSWYTAGILNKAGIAAKKTSTVYHGLEDSWFDIDDASPGEPINILFFGDAVRDRGLEDILAVIPEVSSSFSGKVRFTLALRYFGENYAGEIAELSRAYPVEIAAKTDSMVGTVAESDIVALPYRATTIQPPLTLVESLAAGKAVVTTGVDANAEFTGVNERALLITPGNREELKNALIRLLTEPKLRRAFSYNARDYIRNEYRWDRVVDKIMNIYHSSNQKVVPK